MDTEKNPSQLPLLYAASFITVVAFSMYLPLLPAYATLLGADALVVGLLGGVFALSQFLFSPFWGMLSDRIGRKPVIASGLLGLSLSMALFGITQSLTVLFLSRFLQGIFSGAVIPGVHTYAADITTKEERARAMGRVGAFLALGLILGPAIGGYLGSVHISLPFLAGGLVSLLNFLLVLWVLPESLKAKTGRSLHLKKIFLRNFEALWKGIKSPLAPLFLLAFIWSYALSTMFISVPLLGAAKFQIGQDGIGLLFAVFGLVTALVQFVFLSQLAHLLGQHRAVAAGLGTLALGFLLMSFAAPSLMLLFASAGIIALGSGISRPLTTALLSEETAEGQGASLGIANAYESMGRLLGPLFAGFFFGLHPALPFLLAGGAVLLALLFVLTRTHFLKAGHTF